VADLFGFVPHESIPQTPSLKEPVLRLGGSPSVPWNEGAVASRGQDATVARCYARGTRAVPGLMKTEQMTVDDDGRAARGSVRQLRLVVEAEDFDDAVRFYRDVLGLDEEAAFDSDGGARVMILEAGRATLELANPAQKRMIDEVEVGRDVAPRLRVAFEVDDAEGVTRRLSSAGATVVAPPVETPWRSLNARLAAPADLQLTVFQELDPPSR
jgi:predicted enzyme related to lactoylglutathione lyase